MAKLSQLGSKITNGVSTTGNALNLADNILDNDTVIGDFMDMAEGSDFLTSILGGIKDFLHKIGEAYEFLKKLITKILDFVNEILSYLDLNKLFDALGMKYLLDLITSVVGNSLLDGILGDRQDLISLLNKGCVNTNSDAFRNPFAGFILAGIIMTLGCGGEQNTFTLLDISLKSEAIETHTESTSAVLTELSLVDGLDSEDPVVASAAIELRDSLTAKRFSLDESYAVEMAKADSMLHNAIYIAFNNAKPSSVENLLLDMSKIPAFTQAKYISNTTPIMQFIDKIDEETITSLDYSKLKSILHLFDPNIINTHSNTLAYTARASIKNTQLSVTPTDISVNVRAMIKPTEGGINYVNG